MAVAGRTQGVNSKRARGSQDGEEKAGPQRKAWLKVVRFTDHLKPGLKRKECAVEGF